MDKFENIPLSTGEKLAIAKTVIANLTKKINEHNRVEEKRVLQMDILSLKEEKKKITEEILSHKDLLQDYASKESRLLAKLKVREDQAELSNKNLKKLQSSFAELSSKYVTLQLKVAKLETIEKERDDYKDLYEQLKKISNKGIFARMFSF